MTEVEINFLIKHMDNQFAKLNKSLNNLKLKLECIEKRLNKINKKLNHIVLEWNS